MFSWAALYGEWSISVQFAFCQVYGAEDALHEREVSFFLFFFSPQFSSASLTNHKKNTKKRSGEAVPVDPGGDFSLAFTQGEAN